LIKRAIFIAVRPVSSCGVGMSVCLSRSYILSKQIIVSSKFYFHHR